MTTLAISAAAILTVALATVAVPIGRPAVALDDPIRFTGHGAAFGADGKQITVDTAFIARAQAIYLARAVQGATPLQRLPFDTRQRYLADLARGAYTAADRQAALLGNSLLLDWAIDQYQPADAALLRQRNRVLIAWLVRGLGPMGGQPFTLAPHQEAQFAQAGVLAAVPPPAGPTPAVMQTRETYAKRCLKAGVPVPPTWGKTGADAWNSNGVLGAPFISTDKKAEVFVYQSTKPAGVCIALPRYADGPATPIELLGIICQSKTNGNACFWDNQLNKDTQLVARNAVVPLTVGFAAGEELDGGEGGICTACHAGENAYIIHPEDKAFKIDNLEATWYKPFGMPAGWPQNPGPLVIAKPPMGEKSCTTCHALPAIEKKLATPARENYCDAVLKNAIAATMPSVGASHPNANYKTHIDTLLQLCADAAK